MNDERYARIQQRLAREIEAAKPRVDLSQGSVDDFNKRLGKFADHTQLFSVRNGYRKPTEWVSGAAPLEQTTPGAPAVQVDAAPPEWSEWIEWNGGECPIPWASFGEFGLRFGYTKPHSNDCIRNCLPNEYTWGRGRTLTAYRYKLSALPSEANES